MKKTLIAGAIFVNVLFISSNSSACFYDTDCGIGGQCIKSGSNAEGACINPFGKTEKRGQGTYYEDSSKPDSHSKKGKKCDSDTDCDAAGVCIKEDSSTKGACSK